MSLLSKKNQNITKHKYYNIAIEGKKLICPFCQNDTFDIRDVQLNTPSSAFAGVQVIDQTASVLLCGNCGHIEWFWNDVEKLGDPVEIK